MQPLSTLSSVRLLKHGRGFLSYSGSVHPFSSKFLTLAKTGSWAVHFLIMVAVAGVEFNCSRRWMVSAGNGTLAGAVGKGNLFKASALQLSWPDLYSII